MGLVHATADIVPSKQELVESWLPSRSWAGGAETVELLAGFRFDDPTGEVGIETIVWRSPSGDLLQVPLTYRPAPLPGAEEHLLGTMEHTVLGTRWIYDACADPVWAAVVVGTILTGGTQAQVYVERDGERVNLPARLPVQGSGSPGADVPAVTSVDTVTDDGPITVVTAGAVTINLARVVGRRSRATRPCRVAPPTRTSVSSPHCPSDVGYPASAMSARRRYSTSVSSRTDVIWSPATSKMAR